MFTLAEFHYIVPAFVLTAILLISVRMRTMLNPTTFIAGWWGFWLWLATFSFTGIYPPHNTVIYMTLTLIVGLTVGTYLAKRPIPREIPMKVWVLEEDRFYRAFRRAYPWALALALAMIVPVFIRGLVGLATMPEKYKATAFGTLESPGYLFGSNLLQSLYFTFSGPFLLGFLLFGMALFFIYGKKSELFTAIALNVMDAIMRLGRINVYIVCLLFVLGGMLILGVGGPETEQKRALHRRLKMASLMAGVSLAIIIGIGVARADMFTSSIRTHFRVFVVEYHTIGFALVTSEIENPQSKVYSDPTYGRLTFGGLESLVTILIRRFDRNYNSPASENVVEMSKYVSVGKDPIDPINVPKTYNSYYTILYTFYRDGRLFGLFLGGLALGWLGSSLYSRWRRTGEIESLVWVFFVLSIGILGIFVSTLEITRTWLVVLGLLGLRFMPAPRKRSENT